MLLRSFAMIVVIFISCSQAFAWNDKFTHADMSEYAVKISVIDISKGNYLLNLGFNEGLNEKFTWNGVNQQVYKWLREGAIKEDAGTKPEALAGKARYLNHFHNPLKLKPWLDAGLTGVYSGESSILWSQDTAKQAV